VYMHVCINVNTYIQDAHISEHVSRPYGNITSSPSFHALMCVCMCLYGFMYTYTCKYAQSERTYLSEHVSREQQYAKTKSSKVYSFVYSFVCYYIKVQQLIITLNQPPWVCSFVIPPCLCNSYVCMH